MVSTSGLPQSNVVAITHTATDDLKFRLITAHVWFREGNFFISGNSAKYGSESNTNTTLTPGSAMSFQDFDIGDLYFINAGAGSNTTIEFVGIRMLPGHMKNLGLEGD